MFYSIKSYLTVSQEYRNRVVFLLDGMTLLPSRILEAFAFILFLFLIEHDVTKTSPFWFFVSQIFVQVEREKIKTLANVSCYSWNKYNLRKYRH